MLFHIFCNRALNTRRNKGILLFQTKLLARNVIVIRIKHFTDRTGEILLLNCLLVVSLIKRVEIKRIYRLRIPYPKCIDDAVAISDNGNIVRNGLYTLIILLHIRIPAVLIFSDCHITSKFYFHRIFRAFHLKWIAMLQPVVGSLYLKPIFNFLHKHAVFITDTTSVRRITERRQRLQKTGCQSSQTTVSERRIRLLVLNDIQVHAKLFQHLPDNFILLEIDNHIP